MEELKYIKLKDVCDLIPGFAFKSNDFGCSDNRVIKIGDIQPPYVKEESLTAVDISKYPASKLEKFKVKYDDFVLAMTGATIGKIGRYIGENPVYLNQRVLLFKPKDGVNRKYIYYCLMAPTFQKYIDNHIDSQTAQPNISANSVSGYEIPLPDIATQNHIASILSSIDEKIELNNRINHNLEEQAQAIYKSWFVDFEPFKDGEFIESELGMIPEGWKVGQLSEICDIVGGGTPSKAKAEFYTDNGIHWLTPKDLSVSCQKFTSKGQEDITELGYKSSSAKLMPKGTVLFSSRAPIGYITIAKNPICTNQGFKSAVPGIAGTAFLYYYLKNNTENIENLSSGSTFKEASGSLMKSLAVIIPPKEVFDEFESIMAGYFASQENIELENSHHKTVRDSLLPRLMSGGLTC